MAVAIKVTVEGDRELRAWIKRLDMPPAVMSRGLKGIAFEVQGETTKRQIVAGGRGKGAALKALARRVSSRTGTLRRSIRVNRGGLPRFIEVGSDLGYAAVHEFGGRVRFSASRVKSHTRTVAFGRSVGPYTVPSYIRSAYSASYPKRAFLAPALAKIAPRMPEIMLREWDKEVRR